MKRLLGFTVRENEYWNVLTHGLGLILFVIATSLLAILTPWSDWGLDKLGLLLFFFGLLFVYTMSTLYHYAKLPYNKQRLRVLDHIAIYFLIGGSYSAYLLKYYAVPEGKWFLVLHWLIILIGTLFKLKYTGKYEFVSTALYLLLGWMILPIITNVIKAMPSVTFYWILAGGIAYSVGVYFYINEKRPINHAIWHCFVLLGSGCHFIGLV